MSDTITFCTERERGQTCQELNSETEAAVNLEVKCGSEARAHVDARTTACCVRSDGQYVFSALSDASVELLPCSITPELISHSYPHPYNSRQTADAWYQLLGEPCHGLERIVDASRIHGDRRDALAQRSNIVQHLEGSRFLTNEQKRVAVSANQANWWAEDGPRVLG